MSAWMSSEHEAMVIDGRPIAEDLVAEITSALATAHEYVTCIRTEPTQRVIDFSWAARQAGRRLGIRVDIDMTITKSSDAQAQVRVSTVRAPS